jgi:uncharacterized protein with HEPN domain
MRDDWQRLQDILDAIDKIDKYARLGWDTFSADELIQVWIIHQFFIIGEASRSLSEALRKTSAQVPWPQIIAFRNLIAHHYFEIDAPVVWNIVQHDLPDLKSQIQQMLVDIPPKPSG